MDTNELQEILVKHKAWLDGMDGGELANLREADLQLANLREANLRWANLRWANLRNADLRNADLRNADLRDTDLRWANLRNADLRNADLRNADLRTADLRNADMRDANLDYSAWPLWCGTKDVKVDRKIYLQLLAHLCAVDVDDDECKAHQQASLKLARQSHRAKDLGL